MVIGRVCGGGLVDVWECCEYFVYESQRIALRVGKARSSVLLALILFGSTINDIVRHARHDETRGLSTGLLLRRSPPLAHHMYYAVSRRVVFDRDIQFNSISMSPSQSQPQSIYKVQLNGTVLYCDERLR
jgi:hypothetical protein